MQKKILVVDDEQAICNMLKKFLTKEGYEVTTVLSGEEAIIKVREEKPHGVLLDIKMPGIDGVETLKQIRAIDEKVAIVMITAVKDDVIGRRCIELGAYDYITKPLSLEYLESVLMVKLIDINT
jgi:DNA-binding response OmpR family regulator